MAKIDLFKIAMQQLKPDSWWTQSHHDTQKIRDCKKYINGRRLSARIVTALKKKRYTNEHIMAAFEIDKDRFDKLKIRG